MSGRRAMIGFISDRLGCRDLIWGGLRSDDIEAVTDLPQVAGSFSIIGGHDRGGAIPGVDFEDISGTRVDLDAWDIEDHLDTPAAHEFREAILRRLGGPTAMLPYRSSNFLSSILFARRDRCLDLGLFGPHRAMFDYKPWVETNIAALGVPHVPWRYVADEEQSQALELLSDGPILLRLSRSSGGAGLVRVNEPEMLSACWPHDSDALVGVTPFLQDALPVNIGATVWHDGVTMSHPSVQLIGIPGCTNRPFGYCGNDFGLVSELDDGIIDSIEKSVLIMGRWLRGYNYRGTFGVDFLIHEGEALFTEINARFQGSTHASSQLSSEADESCLMLDHIAAVLGHEKPPTRPLRDIASAISPLSHLVVHWTGVSSVIDVKALTDKLARRKDVCRMDVAAKPSVVTDTGGVVVRATIRGQMTGSGYSLREPWASAIGGRLLSSLTDKGLR